MYIHVHIHMIVLLFSHTCPPPPHTHTQMHTRTYRMREVDIGESKALVVHQNGQFSAIGHKCTHYGAPLVKGYLGSGRVRCPWHGACFNIKNGDIEEFPGLDNIPCFQVRGVLHGGLCCVSTYSQCVCV